MIGVRGLVLVCVSFVFSAAGVIYATPPPEILKVDPNPVLIGTSFEVVYRLQNLSASDHQFQVQMTAEGPIRTNTVTVPANGTLISTLSAVALQPGSHALKLVATEAIGTILVPHGPTGVQQITQWGHPVTASVSYVAYNGVHPPLRPRVSRIGPRDPGTTSPAGNSNSGVIGHLAGSLQSLYAISKHSGVWKSSGGSIWRQLVSAPKHAAVIAVDPGDVRHVIVGERADDTANKVAGEAGVWESRDGGETWEQIYDPGLDPNLSGGTGIRSVAFGPHSRTILIATSRGVGVRAAIPDLSESSRGFEFPDSALGPISELAVSENAVWALSSAAGGTILGWRMDWPGWRDLNLNQPSTWSPWTSTVVPKTVSVWTDNVASSPVDDVPTGGFVGLSAFDDRVFLAFNPSVGPNHPQASLDPGCKAPATKPVCDIFQNRMAILSFDPISSSGVVWRGQLSKDNDGRGLGGRVFTFASTLRCPNLSATIGSGRRLYFVSAQSVQEARSMSANGLFDWSSPVNTSQGMHSDYWDVYLDADTCPPSDFAAWLATDGGVFRGRIETSGGTGTAPNPQFAGTLDGLDWVPASLGLETQNVHALALAKKPTDVLPRILFATGDNDGWWGIPSGPWNGGGTAGDANGALTDGVTPWGIAFRGYSGGGTCGGGNCAYATAFNSGTERSFNVGGRTVPFASSTVFTFIQKLATEIQNPGAVEAVMLVQLPLMDATGTPISGVLGSDNTTTRMAIVRTADYASHTGDFSSGWSIERDSLPPETERFWVTGGSLNTHYYLFTPSASSCLSGLMGEARGKALLGQWTCLHTNLEFADDEAAKELRDSNFVMAPNGPAFVNPYEPNVILVTSLGPSPAIEVTLDGGLNFCPLPGLTGLVTHSGQLPLSGDDGQGRFNPGARFSEVGSRYHGGVMSRIANVNFDRANPFRTMVVTPSAGVYYGDLSLTPIDRLSGLKCKEPTWLALQGIGENWGYPSTGALLDGTAYLGTEGNGIFQISSPSAGLEATYFDLPPTFATGSAVATLKTSRAIVPWTRYTLRVIADIDNANRRKLHPDEPQALRRTNTVNGRTDEKGAIMMPKDPVVEDMFSLGIPLACELDSIGDGQHAPAHLRFQCAP